MQSVIKIDYYEEWMKPQIAELFENEYKIQKTEFELFFSKFYEDDFQKKDCICIVALEGKKIIGFQSFFLWPYTYEKKIFSSYQSGNSLVHPNYRGKGLFKLMLNFIYTCEKKDKIDFLMGFPVEASYSSFIKNGWSNILNLRWAIKIINPFAFLYRSPEKRIENQFSKKNILFETGIHNYIKLAENNLSFNVWRENYNANKIFSFAIKEDEKQLCFYLKFNRRSKFINEIIIGNIISNSYDEIFLISSFKKLVRNIRRTKSVSILSIAINEQLKNKALLNSLKKNNFKLINKYIYFIVKPMNETSFLINDPENWMLFRGDIDTW